MTINHLKQQKAAKDAQGADIQRPETDVEVIHRMQVSNTYQARIISLLEKIEANTKK